jgi:hypothetical protein
MKITKSKSEEIAFFLTKSKENQINELQLELSKKLKEVYDKSIPKEILELQKKHPDYFEMTSYVSLYENGFNGQRLFLGKERSIFNQNSRSSLSLNSVDGAILFKLYNKFSDAKKELKDIRIEVQNIILMLGTKLKVLKEFPEAESCFKDVNSKCTDVSICVSDIRKKIFTK